MTALTAADVEFIARKCGKASGSGSSWECCCPGHDDTTPSLSLDLGDDGKLLWRCHAKCTQDEVLDALRKRGLLMNGADHEPRRQSAGGGRVVATYPYTDEGGTALFRKLRYAPKAFSLQRPNGKGGWIDKIGDARRVLYRLPEVVAAEEVWVVEGEKDADCLASLGLIATTNFEGAGEGTRKPKWRKEYSATLAGKRLVFIPDNDDAGRAHMGNAARCCREGGAASIRVLTLDGLPPKGDVSDWLDRGHTVDELRALVASAAGPGPDRGVRAVEIRDFLRLALPPREMLLSPVVPEKGLVMIYAPRGVGKTHVGLAMAYAIASGGDLFAWKAPTARKVLCVDGEMPARALQERVASLVAASEAEPPEGHLRFIVADLIEDGLPDLATPEGQAAIEAHLGDADVLLLDNLSSLCRSGRENKADSWQPIQDFLLRLRRRGVTVVMIHHAGKGGQQRGTSRREDVLDTVIMLKRPADYQPRQGARFEVHIEKARGFAGEALDPFEATLEIRDGKAIWSTKTTTEADVVRVAALVEGGLSVREIATELGKPKSTVQRLREQAIAEGKVVELPRKPPHPDGGRGR